MKYRSLILITLIFVVPLGALTWAVLRIAESDQVVVQQQFHGLLMDRLNDVNGNMATFFEGLEADVIRITAIDSYDIEGLREINRTEPRLQQLFVLRSDGALSFPDAAETTSPLSVSERSFLVDAAKMFIDRDLRDKVLRTEQQVVGGNPGSSYNGGRSVWRNSLPSQKRQTIPSQQLVQQPIQSSEFQQEVQMAYQQNTADAWTEFEGSSGWFNWYWDRGVNLIYWQRRPSGEIVGASLERARWISDLIGQLPDTVAGPSNRNLETRIRLVNASGDWVYQWGAFEPAADAEPFCELPVTFPLESWRLQCFVSTAQLATGTGSSVWISLAAMLTAVTTVLGICGFLFVKQYSQDMQEATQQVSFVNQVSHELKTPLTNIRMYAELLEHDLDQLDEDVTSKPSERLNIILSEGQRLSRLIGNVLTFARQKRQTLQLQPRLEQPCSLIAQIVERFRPAFVDQHIDIRTNCEDNGRLSIDPDFVEQILGNLISNVEKYAASGGLLEVNATVSDDVLTIDVRDRGPGIETSKREIVFQPFARVSNNVSYAAGTGIGLPIARELARLHGGDLILKDSLVGCWFQATLQHQTGTST